ncbi:1,2-dihydroxy-3-keto-5-methylthiopentene dioxygenase 3 [Piptocephalis cylindrospora]|uniref:Acireductone dioxygenase n=1 Tax=Piptocephalis cylindrospora TaxID=1907219 RepID=A0A4P9Y2X3_9FUNG|nr:1,2-dihydroxy-3-keto-5-methylthiopentene dioxygenase 3 [Piptocephalis cylindrospora]|eukprot:RKP13143.1 1,2-dihydroxy-3-keto-5-methylthiopentene dioxygenase 3 [Piptocephalis cylindrospora]
MRAYLYSEEDPRSGDTVQEDILKGLGIHHQRLPVGHSGEALEELCTQRGYHHRDQVRISPEDLPNYEERMAQFFKEHLHEDEEIRYILEGSGYFDVRNREDQWVRLHVFSGDLVILPAGIYHRFITDDNNFIHTMRLFQEAPKWTPVPRPAEDNPHRISYLSSLA